MVTTLPLAAKYLPEIAIPLNIYQLLGVGAAENDDLLFGDFYLLDLSLEQFVVLAPLISDNCFYFWAAALLLLLLLLLILYPRFLRYFKSVVWLSFGSGVTNGV